jgi:hypothetical protein
MKPVNLTSNPSFRLAIIAVLLLITPAWLSVGYRPNPDPAQPLDPTLSIYLPLVTKSASSQVTLSIRLGAQNIEQGISLDYGGDWDTQVVSAGSPAVQSRRTGNGVALPAQDGNTIPDYYMQFKVSDAALYAGQPTSRLRIEVEYLDQGTDGFIIQYDGKTGGPFGNGKFLPTVRLTKMNTGKFLKAAVYLCDANFANRDNGGDFRIDDQGDGAETIQMVSVTLLPAGTLAYSVDSSGANPWDSLPDSAAIQDAADRACPGDTVLFTSGENSPGYQGYTIDKTVFLLATTARNNLTFTSSDPQNHALLRATAGLRGFVIHLRAKSRISQPGLIDNITVSHLTLDGGRDARICRGADDIENGLDDNWGSWIAGECQLGDPWCRPGGLAMEGEMDWTDPTQAYTQYPDLWSTGLLVDDVVSRQPECGTALSLSGAASTIQNSTILDAGDHMHAPGCPVTDPDEGVGDWSDGITFTGPGHLVTHNTITNPSDVGIVFFGGHDTVISNNTVQIAAGYYGAFAGIAIHGWIFGDMAGVQVTGNTVTSQGDQSCGGMHVGINLGTHMWGAGCVNPGHPAAVGNARSCQSEPAQPSGALCPSQGVCQVWSHVPAGSSLTMTGNTVSGAQINYLVEGLDVLGALNLLGNTSQSPRQTDWESADNGCNRDGQIDTWGILDWVAHHPSLSGWVDQRVHCER